MSSKSSAHVVYVSRSGLAMCPACVTHFRLEEPAHTTTQCPFCETTLGVSVKQPRSLQGLSALTRLNRSKSGMMLAALGVSVTLSACEQKSPEVVEPENVPPVVEIKNGGSTSPTAPSSQPVARDMGTQQDMGADMAADSGRELQALRQDY